MKRLFIAIIAILCTMISATCKAPPSNKLAGIKSWLCFYNDELPAGTKSYDLYVFDSTYYPKLAPFKAAGKPVVGYISLGEVEKRNTYFAQIKAKDLLVDENENWPDSFRVRIGDRKWRKFVVDKLIPKIIAKGFDGIFMDTVDTADYLENVKKMKGQVKGAIDLLKEIRRKYPKLIMVLNNGLFLTDEVGKQIDALVVEDIYTLYDFKTKKYNLATQKWTEERLVPVKKFQEEFKKPILPLDYLKRSDRKAIRKVRDEALAQGFVPYISDIDLKTVFFHP